jgi:hypothetical protein
MEAAKTQNWAGEPQEKKSVPGKKGGTAAEVIK